MGLAIWLALAGGVLTGQPGASGAFAKRTHFVVRFSTYPGPEIRSELARRGMKVVGYVPDGALIVAAGRTDWSGLPVISADTLEPRRKISSALRRTGGGAFLVIFHRDTTAAEAHRLLESTGVQRLRNSHLIPGHFLVAGGEADLERIVALDAVAYVLPASPELVADEPVAACPGPITEAGQVAEYVKTGTGWLKDPSGGVQLRYFFESLTEKMPESSVRGEMERAFREWARYAPLELSAGDAPDTNRTINIRFARGSHGDPYAFDGPGGILGHTFYPAPPNSEPAAGDIHLDADEDWRSGAGVDLFSVALHEAGHALGLGHSDEPGSVMYPYYRMNPTLGADDIAAIQSLYGAAVSTPSPPSVPQPGNPAAPAVPFVPIQPPATPGTPTTTPTTPPGTPTTPPATPTAPPASPTPPAQPDPSKPTGTDRTPPAITIVSPATSIVSTSAPTIVVSGKAADSSGVQEVKWSTSNGDSGQARGTSEWSATVPLYTGTNVVTIRAYDAAGNSGWRAITVVRR